MAATTSLEMSKPPSVDVVSAKSSPLTQRLVLPGETAAWYDSTYARVNGYVQKWLVDIGDHVSNGQTLALIDTPELDAQLQAARAKLSAAQAEVNVKQAHADFARAHRALAQLATRRRIGTGARTKKAVSLEANPT